MTSKLPPSASVATAAEAGKLFAPSAARNVDAITQALLTHAPQADRALEIASGTGQHVVAFARALPDVKWQPTEIDATRRISIDSYAAEAGLTHVAPAIDLNATRAGWAKDHAGQDLILLCNLLHLVSSPAAETLINEAAMALAPLGRLMLYGPFKRDGQLISEGDIGFDAALRAADPAIGYKDTADMDRWLARAGLMVLTHHDMPANNLAIMAEKPA